jgi:hypothetical protein
MVRATHMIRGFVSVYRLKADGEIVLEEYRFPGSSFRRWERQYVGESLTGDFWLEFRPDFYGQKVRVPFLDGHLIEEKTAWYIEPYDELIMRGPSIDLDGLEAYMASARSEQAMLEAELAARAQRDPASIPIAELDLWGNTHHPLERVGLETVGDLCTRSAEDLKREIGLSENSVAEVREALAYLGMKLKGD